MDGIRLTIVRIRRERNETIKTINQIYIYFAMCRVNTADTNKRLEMRHRLAEMEWEMGWDKFDLEVGEFICKYCKGKNLKWYTE